MQKSTPYMRQKNSLKDSKGQIKHYQESCEEYFCHTY